MHSNVSEYSVGCFGDTIFNSKGGQLAAFAV